MSHRIGGLRSQLCRHFLRWTELGGGAARCALDDTCCHPWQMRVHLGGEAVVARRENHRRSPLSGPNRVEIALHDRDAVPEELLAERADMLEKTAMTRR